VETKAAETAARHGDQGLDVPSTHCKPSDFKEQPNAGRICSERTPHSAALDGRVALCAAFERRCRAKMTGLMLRGEAV